MAESATVKQDTAKEYRGLAYIENTDVYTDYDTSLLSFVVVRGGEPVAAVANETLALEITKALCGDGDSAGFFRAVQRGDVSAARAELDQRPHVVDVQGMLGSTPLLMSAESGDEAMVSLLIEFGANLDARDNADNTPLMQAAWEGHTGVVRLLAAAGADLELVNNEDATALNIAAYHDHPDVIDALFEAGADLEHETEGLTALHIACKHGNAGVVGRLLEAGADLNRQALVRTKASTFALRNGHNRIANMLYQAATNSHASPWLER